MFLPVRLATGLKKIGSQPAAVPNFPRPIFRSERNWHYGTL